MIVELLTEHHSEFLNLKRGCRGSSESTLVKMSNCWESLPVIPFNIHCIIDSLYLHGGSAVAQW